MANNGGKTFSIRQSKPINQNPKVVEMKKLLGNSKQLKTMEKKLRAKMKVFDESLDVGTVNDSKKLSQLYSSLDQRSPTRVRTAYSNQPYHLEMPSYRSGQYVRGHSKSGASVLSFTASKLNSPSKLNTPSKLESPASTLTNFHFKKPYELSRKSSFQLRNHGGATLETLYMK
jgi:hypothetical protein